MPEQLFTSRITTLDNTPVQLKINSQETSYGPVSIERSDSIVIIRKEGGFSQPQELLDIQFGLGVGAREFASTLHINAYEAAGGPPIAIADNNGSIKDENGEELLKATVGNGATLVAGSLIKIADSDGDGKVRGNDITVDLNGDDIPDLLPSSDILASGIIDLSVVTQASADPLTATLVDVDLANPVIANRYRKFFNNQWNDFVYDPLRPELGGAELLDANGDGLIEKVRLHLFDSGAGDNDGVVNGVIVDPGALVIDETQIPEPPAPQAPSISINPQSAKQKEGNRGTTPFSFVLSRSGDLSGVSSVQFSVQGIGSRRSKASSSDFAGNRLPSGTITFNPGESSTTLTLSVRGDRRVEKTERFSVLLSDPANGVISSASAIGVIRNDDRRRRGGGPGNARDAPGYL